MDFHSLPLSFRCCTLENKGREVLVDLPDFVQICLQVLAVHQVVDEVSEVVMFCLCYLVTQ